MALLKQCVGFIFLVIGLLVAVGGTIYVGVPSLFLWERNPWMGLWIIVPLGMSLVCLLLGIRLIVK